MFRFSDTLRTVETPDGAILLEIHHGQMFSLNPVGAKILRLLERGYDQPRIATEIVREYAIDPDVARRHVSEFLEMLCRHQLLCPTRQQDNEREPELLGAPCTTSLRETL